MSKKTSMIVSLISCLFLVWFLWAIVNQFKRCAAIGMISAVHASFITELRGGNPAIHQVLGDIKEGITLNTEQYDQVISELLAKGHNLDHPKLANSEPFSDSWGNRLVIWCRKLEDGRYLTQVTSNGKDGIWDTADDISSGERVE